MVMREQAQWEFDRDRVALANPIPREPDDPSVQEARAYLPQLDDCSIAKDGKYSHRWVIHYSGQKQKIWTRMSTHTESPKAALMHCRRIVWAEHAVLTGQICPHAHQRAQRQTAANIVDLSCKMYAPKKHPCNNG